MMTTRYTETLDLEAAAKMRNDIYHIFPGDNAVQVRAEIEERVRDKIERNGGKVIDVKHEEVSKRRAKRVNAKNEQRLIKSIIDNQDPITGLSVEPNQFNMSRRAIRRRKKEQVKKIKKMLRNTDEIDG